MTNPHIAEADHHWSEEFEVLHEESGRTHFLDVWTRQAMVSQAAELRERPRILDLGCSSGYLLGKLRERFATAAIFALEFAFSRRPMSSRHEPGTGLLPGEPCAISLADPSCDALVSAILPDHVPDDVTALTKNGRLLYSGQRAVNVIRGLIKTHDTYCPLLLRQRRYARGEPGRRTLSVPRSSMKRTSGLLSIRCSGSWGR